jgi:hypothetical protein
MTPVRSRASVSVLVRRGRVGAGRGVLGKVGARLSCLYCPVGVCRLDVSALVGAVSAARRFPATPLSVFRAAVGWPLVAPAAARLERASRLPERGPVVAVFAACVRVTSRQSHVWRGCAGCAVLAPLAPDESHCRACRPRSRPGRGRN